MRRLSKLHNSNPNCHWCGRTTIIYSQEFLLENKQPEDMATLDHLFSRNHPRRRAGQVRNFTVLACIRCNQRRAHLEQRLGVEAADQIFQQKRTRSDGSASDNRYSVTNAPLPDVMDHK